MQTPLHVYTQGPAQGQAALGAGGSSLLDHCPLYSPYFLCHLLTCLRLSAFCLLQAPPRAM